MEIPLANSKQKINEPSILFIPRENSKKLENTSNDFNLHTNSWFPISLPRGFFSIIIFFPLILLLVGISLFFEKSNSQALKTFFSLQDSFKIGASRVLDCSQLDPSAILDPNTQQKFAEKCEKQIKLLKKQRAKEKKLQASKWKRKEKTPQYTEYSRHNCVFQSDNFKHPVSHTVSCHLQNVCFDLRQRQMVAFEGAQKKPFWYLDNLNYGQTNNIPIEFEFSTDFTWLRGEPWHEPYARYKLVKNNGTKTSFLKGFAPERVLHVSSENTVIFEQIDPKNIGHIIIDDIYSVFLLLKTFGQLENVKEEGASVIVSESCDGRICQKRSCNGVPVQCPIWKDLYRSVCSAFHNLYLPLMKPFTDTQKSGFSQNKLMFLDELTAKHDIVCFENNLFVGTGQFGMHNWGVVTLGAGANMYDYTNWYKTLIFGENFENLKKKTFFPKNSRKNLLLVVKKGGHKSGCSNERLSQQLVETFANDTRVNVVAIEFSSYSLEDQFRLTHEADIMVAPRGAGSVMGIFMREDANTIILDDNHKYESYFWAYASYVEKQWCFRCCDNSDNSVKSAKDLIEHVLK